MQVIKVENGCRVRHFLQCWCLNGPGSPHPSLHLAEIWGASEEEDREGERAEDEWAHCFFPSPFRVDHRPSVFSCYTSSVLSFASLQKSVPNRLSLHMAYPWISPLFFSLLVSLPLFKVVWLAPQNPSLLPHPQPYSFSFERHHIRIYMPLQTTAHSPERLLSKLLLCNVLVVCDVGGQV